MDETTARLTPEERAYHDLLAEAVEMGVYGERALEYADRMRNTMHFQALTLHHALADAGAVIRQSPVGRLIGRLAR